MMKLLTISYLIFLIFTFANGNCVENCQQKYDALEKMIKKNYGIWSKQLILCSPCLDDPDSQYIQAKYSAYWEMMTFLMAMDDIN